MKSRILPLVALAAATAFAQPAAAQGLTGTWTVTSEGGRGGTVTQTLTLAQDGASLSGTMTFAGGGRRGGGGRGLPPLPITDASVDANAFSFTVTIDFQGNTITQVYEGTLDGERISGTVEGPFGERPFSGTRGG